ncbi:MAG: DUF2993 domain-containing protein [Cyanobacteria bacterium J06649_4]
MAASADEKKGGSRVIGKVLPTAVRFWLRSQVEQIGELSIELAGRDRQLISGYLPRVAVAADEAIYKGIHIGKVQLSAEDIRLNVGQIIRGKPLRLLKEFPVLGSVELSAVDLTQSLTSPLLVEGLLSFWKSLIWLPAFAQDVEARYGELPLQDSMRLHNPQIQLGEGCLGLSFYPAVNEERASFPIVLGTGLSVVSEHFLQLDSPYWLEHLGDLEDRSQVHANLIDALQGFRLDLGVDTQLSELSLQTSLLSCCGQLMVKP